MIEKHKALQDISAYRQNFYLWMFLAQEGLWEDAKVFLKENMGIPTPFEPVTNPYIYL